VTRIMGDAIHDNVPALAAIKGELQLAAGYVTGTPDIQWTSADWAEFAGLSLVTIDQGANGSPVPSADVRDVETGAWTPEAAVNLEGWTAAQPTIYCSLDTLPQVTAAGWRGAVWVADWTGSPPAEPPAGQGATVVAVQYASLADYDLSVVFDPNWPAKGPDPMYVTIPGVPGQWVSVEQFYSPASKTAYVVGVGTNGLVYMTKSVNGGTWTSPVVL
jgi:hypothetical protein